MQQQNAKPTLLAIALATSLGLAACGGGGGNVRPSNPPTPPPTAQQTCQDSKATNYGGPLPCAYPAPKCEDQSASNYGGALPCVFRYTSAKDSILVPAGADIAHSEGYTGQGVKVGMVDDNPIGLAAYAPLADQVVWHRSYVGHDGETDQSPKSGHGMVVGAVLAGKKTADFNGGVAPGASLYWGGVCWEDRCSATYIGNAVRDMGAQGVRLLNMSIGGYEPDASKREASAKSWAYWLGVPVRNLDGLVVLAAGNDDASEVSSVALAPLYDVSLNGHFLATMAVALDAKGNVTGKAAYSNACGSAAQWCLAAPGLVYFPGVPDSAFSGGGGQGTSFATPIVTGTAALVWQAFPWMSAKNVQQTVLTTATDLGEAGVDAIYGWGLVNAAKAVHGPGQLVGTFDANVIGNGTFSNAITGTGNLVKRGSGALTLTGANTYSGGTRVDAGILMLTGTLGSSVLVNGGTFGSKGGKVTGDYTVKAGATTAIQLGTGLSITGNASLAGTLQLLPENSGYTAKPTETILTAGKVNGTFGNVTYGSGFFWTAALTYTDTQVDAALTRASAAAAAMASGASVAVVNGGAQADVFLARVDGLATAGNASESMQSMAASLASAPTVEAASASLASLTGEVHGTARTVAVQRALNAGKLLADRTRSLGAFGETGVWVQATDNTGKLRRDGYSSARYSNTGAMVGVDVALDDGLTVGAALGGSRNHANLDGPGGRFEGTGTTLAAYGRAEMGEAGYVAGNLSIDRNSVDVNRAVVVGASASDVTGERTDTAVQARIEAGWALASGLTPYAAVTALRHSQGSFTEAGGEGFGLTAGKDDLTATFAELGLRFDRSIGQWVIGGDVSARRLLGGADTSFTAAFAGAPEAAFDVVGQALGKDSFRIGGHAFYRTARGWIVYVTAGTERGTGQRSNTYATAGFKVGF